MTLVDDLALIHALATRAEEIALSHFARAFATRQKADGSLVTEADLEVEHELCKILRERRPSDAILAEESGATGRSRRRWIIDPIDGTSWFVKCEEGWGTHIALEVDGVVQIAVLTRPTIKTRWWAAAGAGAYRSTSDDPLSQEHRLSVSDTSSGHLRVGGYIPPESPSLRLLVDNYEFVDNEISVVAAVAEGRLDACLDEGGNPWDQAPGTLIIREAGGQFTDPLGGDRIDLYWGLYSNGHVHQQLMDELAPLFRPIDVVKEHCPEFS